MAPSRAPHRADWRLTRAVSSCRAGSQLPQGKALYFRLGLRACAEICAFTFGLRLSSEPNFSPRLHQSPPWPWNQPFFGETADFLRLAHLTSYDSVVHHKGNCHPQTHGLNILSSSMQIAFSIQSLFGSLNC
ncbi:uncharacterized protein ACOB8E_016550 isoform 2-T2 [Sarcophilus harrisii]